MTKFKTKKWIKLNHLSVDQYSAKKNIRLKNSVLRSDLSRYSDAYIVVKEEWVLQALIMLTVETEI